MQRDVECRRYFDRCGSVSERQGVGHLDLVADLDAPAAPDTLVRIVLQSEIVGRVIANGLRIGRLAEHFVAELVFVGVALEIASPIFVAGGASTLMFTEEQLKNGPADFPDLIGAGSHDPSIPGLGNTGRLQTSLAFDFNKAQAAGAAGGQSRIVTQVRNLDAIGKSSLKYRLSLPGCDLFAVYCQF